MSETALQKSDFAILDKADEEQIKTAGEQLKGALVYEMKIKGKPVKQITFIGLKWITLKMSQNGQALEIIESDVHLDKDGDDKKDWFWRAKVKSKNSKTGLETEGIAECPYLEKKEIWDNGKPTGDFKYDYDAFGRTKAHSKAERNSWRKQIPELEITTLLKTAKPEETQHIPTQQQQQQSPYCRCPDEVTIAEWETGLCKNCNVKMSDFKIQRLRANEQQ